MNKDDFQEGGQSLPDDESASEVKVLAIPKPPDILIAFRSGIFVGHTLDGRFLITHDLSENDAADKGGIGLVYLAQDLKLLSKEVVVKILQKTSLNDPDLGRKFQHEKEALIRLDHPNIVRILDSGTLSDGNPYLVMEYIHGYSLRRVLQKKESLSLEFCAHIIESVTAALSAAHAKKILHRDVKPENIMVTPQEEGAERVRLIDFGIARVNDSQLAPATQSERSIGTVNYIAPEQLLGTLEQTPACDVYACATVVYEMLTNELPFKPNSLVEMFVLQEQGVKTPPSQLRPEISDEAERIILKALAFDPKDRPQDARLFGKALADALRRGATQTNLNTDHKTAASSRVTSPSNTVAANLVHNKSVITEIAKPVVSSAAFDGTNDSVPDFSGNSQKSRKRSNNLVWLALGLITFSAIGSLIGFAWWKGAGNVASNQTNSNLSANAANKSVAAAVQPKISYYLNLQKMRGGKAFEPPFRATGREIFESGYEFEMVFKSVEDGYLHLFNEGKNSRNETDYSILYPITPLPESAKIKASQELETGYKRFNGGRGTEIIWIVWTKQPNDVLTAAKQAALKTPGGVVENEETARRLNDFLRQYADEKTETSNDNANKLTIVNGNGDVVVHRMELEHQ